MSNWFQLQPKIYLTDDRFFGRNFATFGSLANFGSRNALGWANKTAFWRCPPPTNLIRKETTNISSTSDKSDQKRNNKYFAHLQQIWSEKKQQIFPAPPTNLIRKETTIISSTYDKSDQKRNYKSFAQLHQIWSEKETTNIMSKHTSILDRVG